MLQESHTVQAGAVAAFAAVANAVGLLDWAGDVAAKAIVTLVLGVVSAFGYGLGRMLWQKVSRDREDTQR